MYGLDYVALRYFNVYGPRMDVHGAYTEVLVRWMERIASGGRRSSWATGSQTMDFVHVADVARANLLAAASDVTDAVFNVASGTETSLSSSRASCSRRWAPTWPSSTGPRARSTTSRVVSRTRPMRAAKLGFEAEIDLREGLRALVEWWRAERAEEAMAWT